MFTGQEKLINQLGPFEKPRILVVGDAIWTNKCPSHFYDFDEFLVSKVHGKVYANVYE
jgi:hypothetical protein